MLVSYTVRRIGRHNTDKYNLLIIGLLFVMLLVELKNKNTFPVLFPINRFLKYFLYPINHRKHGILKFTLINLHLIYIYTSIYKLQLIITFHVTRSLRRIVHICINYLMLLSSISCSYVFKLLLRLYYMYICNRSSLINLLSRSCLKFGSN